MDLDVLLNGLRLVVGILLENFKLKGHLLDYPRWLDTEVIQAWQAKDFVTKGVLENKNEFKKSLILLTHVLSV